MRWERPACNTKKLLKQEQPACEEFTANAIPGLISHGEIMLHCRTSHRGYPDFYETGRLRDYQHIINKARAAHACCDRKQHLSCYLAGFIQGSRDINRGIIDPGNLGLF